MDIGPIRNARNAGVSLAFQEWGRGRRSMLVIPPMAQNIELTWERPEYRYLFARLGSFCHVVHFDKRGTGASGRSTGVPTLDQRVDDTCCVMDAAGIERAVLMGVSEGGPMAMLLAAAYPERVEALVLLTTAAKFVPDDASDEEQRARLARREAWLQRWGTDETISLDVFAPSVAHNQSYRQWQPRYERHSATPAAMVELVAMLEEIDVRPVLGQVMVPTLVVHRRDDPIVPAQWAREVATMIPDARFAEVPGADHFGQVGEVDPWVDEIERFVTGAISKRPPTARPGAPEIRTMGGFSVRVDGQEVPLSAWGSRRARQLCKRLAVALGHPVTRDELAEILWPDAEPQRLSSRLSVQLSTVRRILGGAIVADRAAVRLDLTSAHLDLDAVYRALSKGDDEGAVAAYGGELLPEDAFEDWTVGPRSRLRDVMIGARRRLATGSSHDPEAAALHLTHLLDLDPYDEWAHEHLVQALVAAHRPGEARRAEQCYRSAMSELGIRPRLLLTP